MRRNLQKPSKMLDDKAQFWHQEAPALLTLCNEHHSDDLTNWCLGQITNNSDAKFWHEHSINILLGIQSIRDCKSRKKAKTGYHVLAKYR